MATLHLLSQSPFASRLDSVLRLLGPHDGLLLCGDACHALQAGSGPRQELERLPDSIKLYALEEDVTARGVELPERVKALDYPGFVELCTHYAKVNGWL